MHKLQKIAIVALVAVLVAVSEGLVIYYVDSENGDNTAEGAEDSPWKTAAFAFESAESSHDDEVFLKFANGDYNVNGIVVSKQINISPSGGVKPVFISDGTEDFALKFTSYEDISIESVVFSQSTDTDYVDDGFTVVIADLGDLDIIDCEFQGWKGCDTGGCTGMVAISSSVDSTLSLSTTTFASITHGVGVWALGPLTVSGCEFSGLRGFGAPASSIVSITTYEDQRVYISDTNLTFGTLSTEESTSGFIPSIYIGGVSGDVTIFTATINGAQGCTEAGNGVITLDGSEESFTVEIADLTMKFPHEQPVIEGSSSVVIGVAVLPDSQGDFEIRESSFEGFPENSYHFFMNSTGVSEIEIADVKSGGNDSAFALMMDINCPSAEVTVDHTYFNAGKSAAPATQAIMTIVASEVDISNVSVEQKIGGRGAIYLSGTEAVTVTAVTVKVEESDPDHTGLYIVGPMVSDSYSPYTVSIYSYSGNGQGMYAQSPCYFFSDNYSYTTLENSADGVEGEFLSVMKDGYLAEIVGLNAQAVLENMTITVAPGGVAPIIVGADSDVTVDISSADSCFQPEGDTTSVTASCKGGDCNGEISFTGLDSCGVCGGNGTSCDDDNPGSPLIAIIVGFSVLGLILLAVAYFVTYKDKVTKFVLGAHKKHILNRRKNSQHVPLIDNEGGDGSNTV